MEKEKEITKELLDKVETGGFGWALVVLRNGGKVARKDWYTYDSNGLFLGSGRMSYLVLMKSISGDKELIAVESIGGFATYGGSSDLVATDWFRLPEGEKL